MKSYAVYDNAYWLKAYSVPELKALLSAVLDELNKRRKRKGKEVVK